MALLEYNLTAVGLSAIERAFRSIEGYAAAHNRKMAQMFGQPVGGPMGGGYSNAVAARTSHQAANDAAKMYGPGQREFAKSVDYRIKQELKAEREVTRILARTTKAHEKAEREKTRETERETKKREKLAEAEGRAMLRGERRGVAAAQQESRRKSLLVSNGIRGTLGGAGKVVTTIGAAGLGLTGLAGGAAVANAVHGRAQIEAAATGLANQMVPEGATQEQILAQRQAIVGQVNAVRGASSMDAIGSARAFGGISGNYGLGLKMAQDFTKISLATDVGLEDISRLAGNAYMKIKTPGMSEDEARKQTLEAVRTFAGQGNIGAVEIKDLAEYGGRLTAAAAQFKGSRVENMAKMGTLAQVAVGSGSATDAAEATMAAARFASDLTEHAKDVSKLTVGGKSINPFTDKSKTQFRSIDTLVADIMQGTGGDMSKMKDIFGERSYKMAQGFQQIYLDAEKNQKGSGRQAVMDKFTEFMKSSVSEKDVETRAAARLQDADMQLASAIKVLNDDISKSVTPAFVEMLGKLHEATPAIGEALGATKYLVEAFGGLAKLVNGITGVSGSNEEERQLNKDAVDAANLGTIKDPKQRVEAARALEDKASKELDNTGWIENIAAFFSGTDTAAFTKWKAAHETTVETENGAIAQLEKDNLRKAAEALENSSKSLEQLIKEKGLFNIPGLGAPMPPRGTNGTNQQPESGEGYHY